MGLNRPEYATVLEPCVGEYAVQPAEHVDQVLYADVLAMTVTEDDETAWKDLLVGDDVGCPVEGMTAVVNGTAALGLLVYGAEELPLGSAHLGARVCTAWRGVEEEADDERVALGDEEAAELVEPDGSVDAVWGLRKLQCCCARDWLGVGGGMVAVEGG